jgi:ATP-dependent Clp protease ATP-binding subunit ClpB
VAARRRTKLAGATKLKEQLDQARHRASSAQRDGDTKRPASCLRRHPRAGKQLAEAEERSDSASMLDEAVTDEHIAGVVSRWTGIPVDKMLEGEREKLLPWRKPGKRVVGQDEALVAVSNAVRRARAGLQDPTGRSARSCSSAPPASARPS